MATRENEGTSAELLDRVTNRTNLNRGQRKAQTPRRIALRPESTPHHGPSATPSPPFVQSR